MCSLQERGVLALQLSRSGNQHTLRLQLQAGEGNIEAVLRETRGAALEIRLCGDAAQAPLLHRVAEALEQRSRQARVEPPDVTVTHSAGWASDEAPKDGRQHGSGALLPDSEPVHTNLPRRLAATAPARRRPSATDYLG